MTQPNNNQNKQQNNSQQKSTQPPAPQQFSASEQVQDTQAELAQLRETVKGLETQLADANKEIARQQAVIDETTFTDTHKGEGEAQAKFDPRQDLTAQSFEQVLSNVVRMIVVEKASAQDARRYMQDWVDNMAPMAKKRFSTGRDEAEHAVAHMKGAVETVAQELHFLLNR